MSMNTGNNENIFNDFLVTQNISGATNLINGDIASILTIHRMDPDNCSN